MDSTMVLVMPNSAATCPAAGATIEEATGDIKVNADTANVAAHFFFVVQLARGL